MTAVEYLSEQMRLTNIESLRIKLWDAIEKAKEMEKEQIVEAFFQGADRESDGHGAMYLSRKDAEKYYNETFKSE